MAARFRPFARLKRRERTALALAAACLAFYLLLTLAVLPRVRQYRAEKELVTDKEAILTGFRETLGREKPLRKSTADVEKSAQSLNSLMLAADKPSLAAAEVQDRVKQIASGNGLEVISEKIQNPIKGDRFVVIPVEVVANGSIEGLRHFLYEVEYGQPLLSIPEITVRVNKKRTYDAATKKYLDTEELQSTLVVTGMMRGSL